MNKKMVNDWIMPAREALIACGIAGDGKIDSAFRSQISSFGAAVVMGSLKAAVAFFAADGNADVPRSQLIKAIYYVIKRTKQEPKQVFDYVCAKDNRETKEKFINASIALKLAMNFFDLGKGDDKKQNGED